MASALALPACQTSDTLSSAASGEAARVPINSPLAPFKDDRFAYRPPLEVRDGGDYSLIPYDEQRDINARDEIPVRKVRAGYIEALPNSTVSDFTYSAQGRTLAVHGAGKVEGGARFTVIYLHGKDGNRDWGFDDERFGGNFNRLKNLMVKNGGAYLSPDFTDFETDGLTDIAALLERQSARGAGKVVIACGSLGNKLCWSVANNADLRKQVSGLVILSGFPDRDFLRVAYSGAFSALPLYMAHGSRDPVYALEDMEDFYQALKAKDQPARMTVFDTGNHGSPIRMIDWRQALNWILSQ